jgi:hypothetical protein
MSVVDPLVSFQQKHAGSTGSLRRRALSFGGGIAVLAILLGLALWLWRDDPRAAAVIGAGLLVFALSAAFPGVTLRVRAAWMWFARLLGRVNTALILAILYVVFVVPWGLVVRITGRTALAPPKGPSYFRARPKDRGREQFERPY